MGLERISSPSWSGAGTGQRRRVSLQDWPSWRSLRTSLPVSPRLSCTSITSARCPNGWWRSLAARHPGTVPSDPEELARFFVFDDFPHFIRNYLAVVDLIKTAEDVRLITYEVAADMAAQNIRYAELTVTPYISISDDLPAEAFLEAIEDARQAASRDHGLELRWIFDIPADFGQPAAELTASVALDHDVPGLVGFGLGGSERGFPRSMFRDQFDRARAAGLRSVPHAGETTGPQSVWDALTSLGAERIEHGIAAAGDQHLLEPSCGAPDCLGRLPDLQRGITRCVRS